MGCAGWFDRLISRSSKLGRPVSARSILAVFAVLAVVGLLAFGLLSKGSSGVAVGDRAPASPLPRLDGGGSESLVDHRGRWVLVNFWASWCGPCRAEAPALESFQRAYGDAGFTVLGIDSRDLSGDGQAFVRQYELSYPQLRDGDGAVAGEFGTTGVPESFLIGPGGRVRLIARGPVSEEYLDEEVAPLLRSDRS
jgi:cytochrome c biogenesis protein CcmG, thiol:disulfide interchange protein DsbE